MITNKEYIHSLITEALKKKKEEPKEATGASSAGGYSGPAFSMFAKDDVARNEYKRPKVKEVREEEYCDSCDSVKSKCVCPKKIEATEATGSGSVGANAVRWVAGKPECGRRTYQGQRHSGEVESFEPCRPHRAGSSRLA